MEEAPDYLTCPQCLAVLGYVDDEATVPFDACPHCGAPVRLGATYVQLPLPGFEDYL